MARYSPVSHVDYVEAELIRSLNWLRESHPHRRFAGCAVLRQLAENAPTVFFVRVKEFFDLIWDPLWDSKDTIRYAASKALSACLAVLSQRTYHLQWYCNLYTRIHDGLKKGTAESVHGSLLVVSESLKLTGDFMVPRFKEVCKAIMQFKDHRSRTVKGAIIHLLPSLAQFCPDAFARTHLDEAMDMLLKCCKSQETKADALLSTGQLCRALGPHLVNRVDELLDLVRDAFLTGSKKQRSDIAAEALQCVADMVCGLGAPFHDRVLTLLEPMLQCGLTEELIDTLVIIGKYIPLQKVVVQQRLLEEATKILGGQPHPQMDMNWKRNIKKSTLTKNMSGMIQTSTSILSTVASSTKLSSYSGTVPKVNNYMIQNKSLKEPKKGFSLFGFRTSKGSSHDGSGMGVAAMGLSIGSSSSVLESVVAPKQTSDLVLLALKTLGSLSTPSSNLLHILKCSVLPYLHAEDPYVRKEAAMTCAKMLGNVMHLNTRGPTALAIEEIITLLLQLVVTDPYTMVRLSLLCCLDSIFDKFLRRAHHIVSLSFLLHDESFEIRLEALKTLGRIAFSNPAAVLPSLRHMLMRIISEIKSSPDNRSKEEAILLLSNFVRCESLQNIVKPFVSTLFGSLPLTGDNRVTTAALEALGEICSVIRQDCLQFADQMIPIIIVNMHDSTSRRKQEMAVKTLGICVSSTGLVVKPYLQYPQLLPWALDLLHKNSANTSWSLRMETLRTLGLLGALEPLKYSLIQSHLQNHEKKKVDEEKPQVTVPVQENIQTGLNERRGTITDRTESNLSSNNSAEKKEGVDDRERTNFKELISSEVLLDDDSDRAPAYLFMYEQSVMRSVSEPAVADIQRKTPNSEDYYPRVSLVSLMKILRDPSLSVHHSSVIQAITLTFLSMGVRCVPFLDQVVPYLLQLFRQCGPGLRESLLQQLAKLVSIVENHISPYLPTLFDIIHDFWSEHLEYVLNLVEMVAVSAPDSFCQYITIVLPLLLSSLVLPDNFQASTLKKDPGQLQTLEQVLGCFKTLRTTLQSHIHLVIPCLCKLMTQLQESGVLTVTWQILTVRTIRMICSGSKGTLIGETYAVISRVVHCLVKVFATALSHNIPTSSPLYSECILGLCNLGIQLGPRFIIFDDLILRTIQNHGINTSKYEDLSRIIRTGNVPEFGYGDWEFLNNVSSTSHEDMFTIGSESDLLSMVSTKAQRNDFSQSTTSGQRLNQGQLARAWDVSQRSTAADWTEWLRRFNIELLRESPSPALRSCSALAQAYAPLAKDLFHAAFVSCWMELNEQYQDSLVRALHVAFKSNTIPPEILQSLLNLAEFMEHDVETLPISLTILAELAQKGHAYAKALHYRELEFQNNPVSCFESLININKKLDQYDAAIGVLKVVAQMQKKHPTLQEVYAVQEAWLSKLGHWDEALVRYETRLEKNPKDSMAIAGKLKCLDSLGRWEEAIKLCSENLDHLRVECVSSGNNTHTKAAVIGARSAWSLNEWTLMDNIVSQLPQDNVEASFLRSVLAVHNENFEDSTIHIERTRSQLDKSITALLAESYGRAYVPLVMVQQCSELEEIIEYKKLLRSCKEMQDQQQDIANNQLGSVFHEEASNLLRARSRTNSLASTVPSRPTSAQSDTVGFDIGFSQGPISTKSIPFHSRNDVTITGVVITDDDSSVVSEWQDRYRDILRRKSLLTEKWRKRIKGVVIGRAAIPFWKSLLNGRKLIISEIEDLETWIDYAALCRDGGNFALAERVLTSIQGLHLKAPKDSRVDSSIVDQSIKLAMLKLQWAIGERTKALSGLEALTRTSGGSNVISSSEASIKLSCLLKLGEWKLAMIGPGEAVDRSTRREILSLYSRATMVDPQSYAAWHQWGLCNYRAIEEARGFSPRSVCTSGTKAARQIMPAQNTLSNDVLIPLATNAVKGLLRAISFGTKKDSSSVMQDMLCILSIWFRYGRIPDVCSAIEAGLSTVHLDNWLGVLPQLIARIDHHEPNTRNLLQNLLIRLGTKHAQALVFPLSVALKSPNAGRKEAAENLMNSLRQHSSKLIEQALMVSQELVRVAILWQEDWHESLEEASRQYFGGIFTILITHNNIILIIISFIIDGNIQAMLDTLAPLHKALEDGPNTLREASFCQAYGHDLREAWDYLKAYVKMLSDRGDKVPTNGAAPSKRNKVLPLQPEEMQLHQAWDLYYGVFKRINLQLPQVTSLELQYCSPSLYNCRDLDLGVPGTYKVNGTAVRIRYFGPTVAIIRSKQRPRKIRIIGDDGQVFVFLLKGHEDLRQDERAMQLFGLVNALLHHDVRTGGEYHALSIQRYAVVPLSPTAGLISWVPNCDTFHDLIRDFRDSRKIMLNVEHKLMQQVAPNNLYDSLSHIHKLEVFEHALANTTGEDLAKILWLKSESSEAWLQRRVNYTRSLAVMSMVGYILGLGDRHPSNLMIERQSGKILHIDFGDCFEVAMQREKFPEKVPFRLTRMLVNAMEVSGIEGNFRLTCEKVMSVLRENRDSLVATLEAFVHDPLISWRLLNTGKGRGRKGPEAKPETKMDFKAENKNESNVSSDSSHSGGGVDETNKGGFVAPFGDTAHRRRNSKQNSAAGSLKPVLENEADLEALDETTNSTTKSNNNNTNDDDNNKKNNIKSSLNELPEQEISLAKYAEIVKRERAKERNLDKIDGGQVVGSSDDLSSKGSSDLHLEMSSLANSSLQNENKFSFSMNHRSIVALSIAQAEAGEEDIHGMKGELTEKAVIVIRRVLDKLTGLDFHDRLNTQPALDVPEQVERLIKQATANENLCLSFFGWCSSW